MKIIIKKMFLLITFGVIRGYKLEKLGYVYKFADPLIQIASGNPFLITLGALIILSFFYLLFSSMFEEHSTNKVVLTTIIILFIVSIGVDVPKFNNLDFSGKLYFLISTIIFLAVSAYVLITEVFRSIMLKKDKSS